MGKVFKSFNTETLFKNSNIERLFNIMRNDLNKESCNFYTIIDDKGNDYIIENVKDINDIIYTINTEDIVYISCDYGYDSTKDNNYIEDSDSGIIKYNTNTFDSIKYKEYVNYIKLILNKYNVTKTERSIKP